MQAPQISAPAYYQQKLQAHLQEQTVDIQFVIYGPFANLCAEFAFYRFENIGVGTRLQLPRYVKMCSLLKEIVSGELWNIKRSNQQGLEWRNDFYFGYFRLHFYVSLYLSTTCRVQI